MHFQEAPGESRAQPKVQKSGDPGPGIQPQATLAAGQQEPARRPGVIGVLTAHGAEYKMKNFQHDYWIIAAARSIGIGISTLVTFRPESLRSMKYNAQSSVLNF